MPMERVIRGGGRIAAGGLLALFVLSAVACESDSYDVTKNLSYDPDHDIYGYFDFYEPKADSGRTGRPAVLAIHGGAWRGGDKAWGQQLAKELCPLGYVVFAINYRL